MADYTLQYAAPSQDDIDNARKFVLRRESYATILESRIDKVLTDTAGQIAEVCLNYNIPAKSFTMTSNEQMFNEVSNIMDEAEEEIYNLIDDFATRVTTDKSHKAALALWIASLGKGNMNLRDTLEGYLYRYLYDLEASIASYKLAMENNIKLTKSWVITQIKSIIKAVYTSPYVRSAMSANNISQMQAKYLRTKGVHRDNVPLPIVGSSNSNANNVVNMALTTLRMAWMREQLIGMQEKGALGYVQLRGSSYPCSICDSEVGVHTGTLEDMINDPYPHPSCQCYRVPLYSKQ